MDSPIFTAPVQVDRDGVAFRDAVSDFARFLERWRRRLTELEKEVPWPRDPGPLSGAQGSLLDLIQCSFVPRCVAFNDRIDRARRILPAQRDAEWRRFSRSALQEPLMEADWMRQASEKPFGYPGDFEVMRYMYEAPWAGRSHFARALGYAFHRTPGAVAVPSRKNLMRQELLEISREKPAREPLRILSVAAGPAQELYEWLQYTELEVPARVVLLEQEPRALDYARRRLEAACSDRAPAVVECLQESIRRLLVDQELLAPFGRFDAILCVGLFDYLRPHTATRLARTLTRRLAAGGRLFFGNMVPDNPTRWVIEHHMDWWLLYRDREELMSLARRAAEGASCQLLEECTGVNPFAKISKV